MDSSYPRALPQTATVFVVRSGRGNLTYDARPGVVLLGLVAKGSTKGYGRCRGTWRFCTILFGGVLLSGFGHESEEVRGCQERVERG